MSAVVSPAVRYAIVRLSRIHATLTETRHDAEAQWCREVLDQLVGFCQPNMRLVAVDLERTTSAADAATEALVVAARNALDAYDTDEWERGQVDEAMTALEHALAAVSLSLHTPMGAQADCPDCFGDWRIPGSQPCAKHTPPSLHTHAEQESAASCAPDGGS